MKQTLLIISALMLIVGCGSDSIKLDINNLIDRGSLMYAPNDEKPYTGDVFELYEDGKKKLDGNYRKGLMNGEWTYYHENGQIMSKGNYKNGDGSYPDDYPDSLKSIYPPIDGRSGKWTEWWPNGQKKLAVTIKDGEVDGKSTYWSPDSKESSEFFWKDGQPWDGKLTFWYENGQKEAEATFKDGKENGLFTKWYENGHKEFEKTYKDGELIERLLWYENGQKAAEVTYKDGELIEETWWNEDGNKK